MLDSEKKKVLLEAVKGRLSITWENEKTEKNLSDMIDDAEIYLNHLLGAECDYSAPGMFRKLFLNYVMYVYNHCEDEFERAYQMDILTLQAFCSVQSRRNATDAENESQQFKPE